MHFLSHSYVLLSCIVKWQKEKIQSHKTVLLALCLNKTIQSGQILKYTVIHTAISNSSAAQGSNYLK